MSAATSASTPKYRFPERAAAPNAVNRETSTMKPATRAGCGLPTTYRADTRRVYIKRADGPSEQAFPLTTATQVAPGDTIRIGERFF